MDHVTIRDQFTSDVPPPAPPPVRATSALDVVGMIVAWAIILGIAGYVAYRNAARSATDQAGGQAGAVEVEIEGRQLVGLDQFIKANPGGANNNEVLAAAAKLNRGSYSQRLRHAILMGELSGPSEAR